MSINSRDPHVRYTQIINFSEPPKLIPYCDSIYDNVNVNGWSIRRGIDENGKITLVAGKDFGQLKNDDFGEAAGIEITVKSTKYKVPQIRRIENMDPYSYTTHTTSLIEIPDGKDRMSESLETDRSVERRYRKSSILTEKEYLSEIFPEFNQIATIAKLNEITGKIKDEMGNVHKDRENYKVSK